MPKQHKKRSYEQLTEKKRDRLQALRSEGVKQNRIAEILRVDPSTISREIKRNRRKYRKKKKVKNKNARYEADVAQHKAYLRRKYAKYQGKNIIENKALRKYIVKKLKKHWNPDEISGRMKEDQEPFYASKTAIYAWLRTADGAHWCKCLYTKRYYVKPRKEKATKRQLIPNRIGIKERPLGATNRTRYGHYEGDTMVSGKKTGSKTALSVIYERKAKYIDARKIKNMKPRSHGGAVKAMIKEKYALTMTYDNGIENTTHEELGIQAYICDPYSSWQKGGVENAIHMIRYFIPKGVDIGQYSDDDIRRIIKILNGKPRKSLRYKTPYEVMVEKKLFKNKKIPSREIALRG
jgi:IS30 family transposase